MNSRKSENKNSAYSHVLPIGLNIIWYQNTTLRMCSKENSKENIADDFSEHLEELQRSCFGTDIDCSWLGHQLYLVHDAVKTTLPEVRQVTNTRAICEAFNKTPVTKTLLGEVHKLLRLYLTFTCGIGVRLPSARFPPYVA